MVNGDDVADWAGAENLIKTAIDTFGGLDILVNNAAQALFNRRQQDPSFGPRITFRVSGDDEHARALGGEHRGV